MFTETVVLHVVRCEFVSRASTGGMGDCLALAAEEIFFLRLRIVM